MHKVTVYSNWVKTSEHEFETQDEAREFAEEMKNQQYVTIIDEEEVEEDDPMDDYNYVGSPDHY